MKKAILALLLLTPFITTAQVNLPYDTGFESADGFTLGPVTSGDWNSASAEIIDTNTAFGDYALKLGWDNEQIPELNLSINGAGENIVFVDFYLKPVAGNLDDLPEEFAGTLAGLTALIKDEELGEIYITRGTGSGSGTWEATGVTLSLTGKTSTNWVRYTYRFNYTTKKWDLYIDNVLRSYNIGFIDNSVTQLNDFTIFGDTRKSTRLDHYYVGDENPLFTDADNDGIDDAYETLHGLNTGLDDRELDKDHDWLSNLNEYFQGLSAGDPDTDNDGVSDGAELANETDPFVADPFDLSTLPFSEDFESYTLGTSIHGQNHWIVEGLNSMPAPQVQNAVVQEGAKAFEIKGNGETITVKNAYNGSAEDQVWIDFHSKPRRSSEEPEIESTASAAFYFDNEGQLLVKNGSTWEVVEEAEELEPGAWIRITLFLNYGTQQWSIWLDGVPVGTNLSFNHTNPFLSEMRLVQYGYHTSYLDGIVITDEMPEGPGDFDSDGMDDLWEEIHFGDLDQDGTEDPDSDGLTNLQEFMGNTDPNDYYNGNAPEIQVFNPNRSGYPNQFVSSPLFVKIMENGEPLSNAPVSFSIISGGGNIAETLAGSLETSIIAETNAYGMAQVEFKTASSYGNVSIVEVTAGDTVKEFTITNIADLSQTGLKIWLTGADVILDGSGNVSQWNGQVGTANAVQSSTSARPLAVNNAISNKPVVRFDGTNDFLDPGNFMSGVTGSTGAEIFVVLKMGDSVLGTDRGFMRIGSASSNGTTRYPLSTGGVQDSFGSTISRNTGVPAQDLREYHIYGAVSKTNLWQNRINGLLNYSTTTNTFGLSTTPAIGFGGLYFKGDIAEIVVYDHELSTTEREAVEKYLANKYPVLVPSPVEIPENLKATTISATQVGLTWEYELKTSKTKFKIEQKVGSGSYAEIAVIENVADYIVSGLSASQEYTYRIKAIDYLSESDYSNEAEVTTLASGTDMPLGSGDLKLWLKADTVAAGSVNALTDQSGNNNHALQTTSGARPVALNDEIGGKPLIRFDGVDDFLDPGNFMNGMAGATGAEFFVVLKIGDEVLGTDRGFMRMSPASGSGATRYPLSTGGVQDSFASTSSRNTGVPTQDLRHYHIYGAVSKTNLWQNRINGILNYSTTTNTFGVPSNPAIGFGGVYFKGDIAEIIVYNSVLSSDQRDAINAYLTFKYGLADFDGDGLIDWWERHYFENTTSTSGIDDSDSDGIINSIEFSLKLDPTNSDTDGDGVNDGDEVNTHGTNPLKIDTDDDGMADLYEIQQEFNPLIDDAFEDVDSDRYPNVFESVKGTDPHDSEDIPDPDYLVETGGSYTTIQSAINAANSAGVNFKIIGVDVGTYNERLEIEGVKLLLIGIEGAYQTILETTTAFASIEATVPAVIDGLTITHGNNQRQRGLFLDAEGRVNISGCIIRDNIYSIDGGGMYVSSSTTAKISNTLFRANKAPRGGGIWSQGNTDIRHCTFIENMMTTSGMAIYRSSGTTTVQNSILWDSGTSEITGTVTVSYSNVRGGFAGTGNTNVNPILTTSGHLQSLSPGLNAGTIISDPGIDWEGELRPFGSTPDMGADEFVDNDGDSLPDWWEVKYGLDPNNLDSDADTVFDTSDDNDGDGLQNADEYTEGWDPTSWDGVKNISVADNVIDAVSSSKTVSINFDAYQAQDVTVKFYKFYYDLDSGTKDFSGYNFELLETKTESVNVGNNSISWDGIVTSTGQFHTADVVAFEVISNQTSGGSAEVKWSSKDSYQPYSDIDVTASYSYSGQWNIYRNIPGLFSTGYSGMLPVLVNNRFHQSLISNKVITAPYTNNDWMGVRDDGYYYTELGGTFSPAGITTKKLPEKAIVYINQYPEFTNYSVESYQISPAHNEVVHASFTLNKEALVTIQLWDPAHTAHNIYYRDGSGAYQEVENLSLSAGAHSLEFFAMNNDGSYAKLFGQTAINGASNNSYDGYFRVKFIAEDPVTGKTTYTWATLYLK